MGYSLVCVIIHAMNWKDQKHLMRSKWNFFFLNFFKRLNSPDIARQDSILAIHITTNIANFSVFLPTSCVIFWYC